MAEEEGAGHLRDTVQKLFCALLDDRVAIYGPIFIISHVDLFQVFPFFSRHVDGDFEIPVLAVIFHHSLVPIVPGVSNKFVVLDQTDIAIVERKVRLEVFNPLDEVIVFGA